MRRSSAWTATPQNDVPSNARDAFEPRRPHLCQEEPATTGASSAPLPAVSARRALPALRDCGDHAQAAARRDVQQSVGCKRANPRGEVRWQFHGEEPNEQVRRGASVRIDRDGPSGGNSQGPHEDVANRSLTTAVANPRTRTLKPSTGWRGAGDAVDYNNEGTGGLVNG